MCPILLEMLSVQEWEPQVPWGLSVKVFGVSLIVLNWLQQVRGLHRVERWGRGVTCPDGRNRPSPAEHPLLPVVQESCCRGRAGTLGGLSSGSKCLSRKQVCVCPGHRSLGRGGVLTRASVPAHHRSSSVSHVLLTALSLCLDQETGCDQVVLLLDLQAAAHLSGLQGSGQTSVRPLAGQVSLQQDVVSYGMLSVLDGSLGEWVHASSVWGAVLRLVCVCPGRDCSQACSLLSARVSSVSPRSSVLSRQGPALPCF